MEVYPHGSRLNPTAQLMPSMGEGTVEAAAADATHGDLTLETVPRKSQEKNGDFSSKKHWGYGLMLDL